MINQNVFLIGFDKATGRWITPASVHGLHITSRPFHVLARLVYVAVLVLVFAPIVGGF